MIERGDDDFIAGFQIAADAAGKCECERRHVGAEVHFVRRGMKKIGHCEAGRGDHVVGAAAGEELAHVIRVRGFEVVARNASITRCGTCVPAGASRNATGWPFIASFSEGNCARTQFVSSGALDAGRVIGAFILALVVYDGLATARMKSPSNP